MILVLVLDANNVANAKEENNKDEPKEKYNEKENLNIEQENENEKVIKKKYTMQIDLEMNQQRLMM